MSGTGVAEGQGFTVSFATLSLTINYVDLEDSGSEVPDVNCSDQATTGDEAFLPGKLRAGGEYVFTINANLLDRTALYGARGVEDVITVTWPVSAAANTAGSDVFTGWIKNLTHSARRGEVMTQRLTIKKKQSVTYNNETTP